MIEMYVLIGAVVVALGWVAFRQIQAGKGLGFVDVLNYVNEAVASVEQISKASKEIAEMVPGAEKNALRKQLALDILVKYAERIGVKLKEADILVLGYAIEAAVYYLSPKTDNAIIARGSPIKLQRGSPVSLA